MGETQSICVLIITRLLKAAKDPYDKAFFKYILSSDNARFLANDYFAMLDSGLTKKEIAEHYGWAIKYPKRTRRMASKNNAVCKKEGGSGSD